MFERLNEIFSSKSYKFLAFLNAFAVWLWGVWILLPFDTFESSNSFDFLASLAPESVWGIFIATVGGISMSSILLGNKNTRWSSMGTFYIWLMISIGAITANWQATSTVIYPVMVLMSAWTWAQSRD